MQKKSLILASVLLLSLTLFAGCFGGEEETTTETAPKASEDVAKTLTEKDFVNLSAEILCLPRKNPNASPSEIEAKAKALVKKSDITELEYEAYQKKIEAKKDEKTRVGYAIIGRMGELCSPNPATPADPATPANPATPAEPATPADPNAPTPAPAAQ